MIHERHTASAAIVALVMHGLACLSPAAPGPTTRVVETPEMGLRAYNYYMRKVDQAGMMSRVYAPTAGLEELARSFTHSDGQVATAVHAAQKKFGGDAGRQVGRAFNDVADEDMVGGRAEFDATGALVTFITPAGGTVPLCVDAGVWKLDARALVQTDDERVAASQIEVHARNAAFAGAVAAGIDSGDIPTLDDAVQRITNRRQN